MNPSYVSQSQPVGTENRTSGESAGAVGQAKRKIAETAEQLKANASGAASRLKEGAAEMANQRKERTADQLGGYSTAMHSAAQSFEEQDPNIAWFTHQAADRIQRVADYVRQHDYAAVRGDLEGVARRHPLALFGGMFIAGLALGNFLRATRRSAPSSSEADPSARGPSENQSNPQPMQTTDPLMGASAAGI